MEYPPKKSSNIWLLCILRKWKKLMLSSSGDDSGRSLRRALSFLQAAKASLIIPKGCFAVSVGDVEKRFVVPTRFLEHPLFRELLREAEEEFGFQHMGVLRIPCDVFMFERVLQMMEGKKMNGKKLGR